MVTKEKHKTVKTIKVKFADENVTSFGGLTLVERIGRRLGLWKELEESIPERKGHYDWMTIIKSAIGGLLSGSQGTYATEDIRRDKTALRVMGLEEAPEEATFWRSLEELGEMVKELGQCQRKWARETLGRCRRNDLLQRGYVPVFGDGTLLEGSERREGSKYIKGKGTGLLWVTLFVGSLPVAQRLTKEGEGEGPALRAMLGEVVAEVLEPLGLKQDALFLMDSLHGDGPMLDELERLGVNYIVGANKLEETRRVLMEQSGSMWVEQGKNEQMGWEESAVCVCWIQCGGWSKKRVLVGRRYKKEGEMFYDYWGVMTSLGVCNKEENFARSVWGLYGIKAGQEDYYKDLLEDMGLHHPPCQEHKRNAGFYTVATLAYMVARAVELIGGKGEERGQTKRQDGKKRKRHKPKRMRLWRIRRLLFSLPGRVALHARQLVVTLLGLNTFTRTLFQRFWENIERC